MSNGPSHWILGHSIQAGSWETPLHQTLTLCCCITVWSRELGGLAEAGVIDGSCWVRVGVDIQELSVVALGLFTVLVTDWPRQCTLAVCITRVLECFCM